MSRIGHSFLIVAPLMLALLLGGCFGSSSSPMGSSSPVSNQKTYPPLTGTAWIPNVAGSGASNHDSSVTESRTTLATVTGPVTGLAQGWNGREITVTIDMTADLGTYGSLSLMAQPVGYPGNLSGKAYPLLVSLSDGTHELVNLTRSNSGGDCSQSGAYTCDSGGNCTTNSSCSVSWPSAFFDRAHWLQHQIASSFNSYASVNTFPTCNWSGGSVPPSTDSQCAFNSTFFSGGKLVSGVTYTAKYVLMADSYSTLSGYNAGVSVTVVKKTKASNANPGAVDVNVILVGHDVSQASRNAKGKINLDSLFTAVHGFYSLANTNVKLGQINAYEWQDGDGYANVATSDLGTMIAAAGSVLPSSTNGKAVNIFFVSTVTDNSSLLGISGAIGGPMANGLPNSGVVVSTFAKLDQFNPNCSAAPCDLTQVEYDFADMEQTITHEMGHYLGLNHPSEATGTQHDVVRDTPICTALDASAGNKISIRSCLLNDTNAYAPTGKRCNQTCTTYNTASGVYCPDKLECEFNYMMYWSSKYFTEGTGAGDGNMFSPQNGVIINYHPLIQ